MLLAWSTLFRSEGTLSNYLGYVQTACMLTKAPTDVFQHPALRRAKAAVAKRQNFAQRPRLWVRRQQLEDMVMWCGEREEMRRYVQLFVLTYAFLLRLPSEALPMAIGSCDGQSSLYKEDGALVLRLRRRCGCTQGASYLLAVLVCGMSGRTSWEAEC